MTKLYTCLKYIYLYLKFSFSVLNMLFKKYCCHSLNILLCKSSCCC